MYFGHDRVKTGPNFSHELPTFLKYHMPLITKSEEKSTFDLKLYFY